MQQLLTTAELRAIAGGNALPAATFSFLSDLFSKLHMPYSDDTLFEYMLENGGGN